VTGLTVVLWVFVLTALAGIYVAAWGLIRSLPVVLPPVEELADVPPALEVESTPFPNLLADRGNS
jgi:hypothetical protein